MCARQLTGCTDKRAFSALEPCLDGAFVEGTGCPRLIWTSSRCADQLRGACWEAPGGRQPGPSSRTRPGIAAYRGWARKVERETFTRERGHIPLCLLSACLSPTF